MTDQAGRLMGLLLAKAVFAWLFMIMAGVLGVSIGFWFVLVIAIAVDLACGAAALLVGALINGLLESND